MEIPAYVLQWLKDELDSMKYGEVGFTLIVANGKISKVKRIHEEIHAGKQCVDKS